VRVAEWVRAWLRLAPPRRCVEFAQAMLFDGNFELAFLLPDERVQSLGEGSGGCEVISPRGSVACHVGDWLVRGTKGELVVCRPPASSGGRRH
jgi:hypothetical protein